MGLFRKITSVSTLGAVDFRSDKERTAAYTKGARAEARKQTSLLQQLKDAKADQSAGPVQFGSAPTPQAAPAAPPLSVAAELERLAALRDSGVLTDEEFAAQKAKLLA